MASSFPCSLVLWSDSPIASRNLSTRPSARICRGAPYHSDFFPIFVDVDHSRLERPCFGNPSSEFRRTFPIRCRSSPVSQVFRARDFGWSCRGAREDVEILSRRDVRGVSGKGLVGAGAESSSDAVDGGFIRSKLAVFLSGGGSNFRALHVATLNNSIYGDIAVVISDKPGCKGCEYAREKNLPILIYPHSQLAQDGLSAPDLVAALRNYGVDYILLAGYLKLLPLELIQAYPRSILNIHPSLLPSFGGKGYYGMKVHDAVIKSGARFSGATIHFVDENFDTGPILAQRIVPVLSDDTPQDLAGKVLKVEHLLYSETVAALCEDRIFWRDDGVPLIKKSWNKAEYY